MRKKNPRASLPFALSDGENLNDAVAKLPPMKVPRGRPSKCPDCHSGHIKNTATEETAAHNRSTSNNVSNGDTDMVLSGTQQVPTAQRNQNSICDGAGAAAASGIYIYIFLLTSAYFDAYFFSV